MPGTNRTIPIVTTIASTTYDPFFPDITNMTDSVMTIVVVNITVTTSDTAKNFPIFTVHFAIL